MERHTLSESALRAALDRLAAVDADIESALARIGYPAPRQRPRGFATLLRIMTAQQLSTRSAAAIWARLEQACAGEVTAARFAALDDVALRAVGLSRRKMAYGRELARAVIDRALDLDALAEAPEDAAVAAISGLRGFGRWSGEIYVLFALGRTDAWPADDLALQVGMQRLKRLDVRPNRRRMEELAEPWRPLRGCGAIFLWHFYGAATLDDAAPAVPRAKAAASRRGASGS